MIAFPFLLGSLQHCPSGTCAFCPSPMTVSTSKAQVASPCSRFSPAVLQFSPDPVLLFLPPSTHLSVNSRFGDLNRITVRQQEDWKVHSIRVSCISLESVMFSNPKAEIIAPVGHAAFIYDFIKSYCLLPSTCL